MKFWKWIGLAVVIVAAGVSIARWMAPVPRHEAAQGAEVKRDAVTREVVPEQPAVEMRSAQPMVLQTASPSPSSAVAPAALSAAPRPAPGEAIRVAPNTVLATVNGQPVGLKDLLPAPRERGAVQMSREDFAHRLEEAIRRRLIFQEAGRQGLGLSVDQRERVEAIRRRYAADQAAYRQQGAQWTSVTEEQIVLETERAEAALVLQNLLVAAGAPPLQATPQQVMAYYEEHRDQYGELPPEPDRRQQAWSDIQLAIRQVLDPKQQEQYLAWQDRYLKELRMAAVVTVSGAEPSGL
jgi:hypothetical protein